MDNFFRTYEIDIWNIKFRLPKRFRFRNRKEYTEFTNKLILEQEPYIYRRFETEYQKQRLQVKAAWVCAIFLLSGISLLFAFLFIYTPFVSYLVMGTSIVFFLIGIYLKKQTLRFAFHLDITRELLLTDSVIEKVREELQSSDR